MTLELHRLKTGLSVKLGRLKPVGRPMAPRFAPYLVKRATPLPPSMDWYTAAARSVAEPYGNAGARAEGDCVIASGYHGMGCWSVADKSPEVIGTTSEALQTYHRIGGPRDEGLVIVDALQDFKTHGWVMGGQLHKIEGWAAVDWRSELEMKTAIALFGSVRVGFNVPGEWMSVAGPGAVWDVPRSRSFVGGHDIRFAGWNKAGYVALTWGYWVIFTYAAAAASGIIDECYVELAPEWFGSDNISPSKFDVAALRADLAKWGTGDLPPWEPPPSPPPPPVPPPPGPPPAPVSRLAITLAGSARVLGMGVPITLTGTADPSTSEEPMSKNGVVVPIAAGGFLAIFFALLAQYGPVILSHLPDIIQAIRDGKTWKEIVALVVGWLRSVHDEKNPEVQTSAGEPLPGGHGS